MEGSQGERARVRHRYQLRHAAGLYWLLDMEQSGEPYISPVPLNEAGAEIWRMLETAASTEEVSRRLSGEYGIPIEEAREDLREFLEQLKLKRVDLGGLE